MLHRVRVRTLSALTFHPQGAALLPERLTQSRTVMASCKYDDDYEDMLLEYEQDVARQKAEATGRSPGFRAEFAAPPGSGGSNQAPAQR